MPSRSRAKSRTRSRSRSKSPRHKRSKRSKSSSRSRRSRSTYSRSRSRSSDSDLGFRVHVADIGGDITEGHLTETFGKYGPVKEVWLARYPPWFAFVVFKKQQDADDALDKLNGAYIKDHRMRLSIARPRQRTRHTPPPARSSYFPPIPPDLKCDYCYKFGHSSRECRSAPYNNSRGMIFRGRGRAGFGRPFGGGGSYWGGGGGGYGGFAPRRPFGRGRYPFRSGTPSPPRRRRRSRSRSRS